MAAEDVREFLENRNRPRAGRVVTERSANVCGQRRHERITSTEGEFLAFTTPAGVQHDGKGGWHRLGNCVTCGSTLAIECDEPTHERCRKCGGDATYCAGGCR